MPRQARIKSESGIYHIMLRGINQQQIFEDEEDNLKFLSILSDYKLISEYELYAYCIMGNHVHILLKEGNEELSQIMKRIGGKYVYWYNSKYKRVGHLFQDRFKSEPVNDEKYLMTVLRYIHQNPTKAKLAKKNEDYKFSSYNEYINGSVITNTEFVLGMTDIENFKVFHHQNSDDKCLDITEKIYRVTDEEAKRIILKLTKCENVSEFQSLETEKRNKLLNKLKEKGLSIRQINRLTGISKRIIERT